MNISSLQTEKGVELLIYLTKAGVIGFSILGLCLWGIVFTKLSNTLHSDSRFETLALQSKYLMRLISVAVLLAALLQGAKLYMDYASGQQSNTHRVVLRIYPVSSKHIDFLPTVSKQGVDLKSNSHKDAITFEDSVSGLHVTSFEVGLKSLNELLENTQKDLAKSKAGISATSAGPDER